VAGSKGKKRSPRRAGRKAVTRGVTPRAETEEVSPLAVADKRVIVLTHEGDRFRVVLWAAVPAERQPFYAAMQPQGTWNSAYPDADTTEQAKLHSGELAEKVEIYSRQGANNAQAQADLEDLWQGFQNEVTSRNPWNRYGTFWDGTAWTQGGVA
jgi:hypothetical protein